MNDVAVIIIHYKNSDDTRTVLKNLTSSRSGLVPIVIVNSSQDSDRFLLSERNSNIIVVRPGENTGFSGGNNLGIRRALELGCTGVLLLNNDTTFSVDQLERLVSFAGKNSSIGIVSPKIYFAQGYEYHKDRYSSREKGKVLWYAGGVIDWNNVYASHRGVDEVDKGQYNVISDTDFATGCCMYMSKSIFGKVGFFDEKYFLYYEDVDYSVRCKKAGFKVLYYPDASISHKNASSSGKPGSELHRYYQTRNRLYFAKKFASLRARKSLLLESIRSIIKGAKMRQAVLDYYVGRMGRRVV